MDVDSFDDHLADFIKAAYTGDNGLLFIAITLLMVFAYRTLHWRLTVVTSLAATTGGAMAGIERYSKIQNQALNPFALVHSVLMGTLLGAGFTMMVVYGTVFVASRLGLPTIGELLARRRRLPEEFNGNGETKPKDKQ